MPMTDDSPDGVPPKHEEAVQRAADLAVQRAADRIVADPATAPPTVNGRVAALVLGTNYWSLLDTVKRGTCPVPVLRVGRSIRFPTRPLLAAVGIGTEPATAA